MPAHRNGMANQMVGARSNPCDRPSCVGAGPGDRPVRREAAPKTSRDVYRATDDASSTGVDLHKIAVGLARNPKVATRRGERIWLSHHTDRRTDELVPSRINPAHRVVARVCDPHV